MSLNLNKLSNRELNKMLYQDFMLPEIQEEIRKILDKRFNDDMEYNDMIERNDADQDVVYNQEITYEEEILS